MKFVFFQNIFVLFEMLRRQQSPSYQATPNNGYLSYQTRFRFTEIVKCYLIDPIKRGNPSYKVTVLLQNGDLITGGKHFQLFNKPDHKKTNHRILDLKGLVMYYHPDPTLSISIIPTHPQYLLHTCIFEILDFVFLMQVSAIIC
jgi:hypothetical protein